MRAWEGFEPEALIEVADAATALAPPPAGLRVLVTGAAGFVGSHLCESLLADGHEVHGVDGFVESYSRGVKLRNLDAVRTHPCFTFTECDLRTAPVEACLEGVDVVINEAAMAGLPRSWTEFDGYASCNLGVTQRLLEGCRHVPIRKFVQISTSSVYGYEAVGDESQPLRPVSPYGVTKLAAEQLAWAYLHSYGVPATILRYFSIYGPRQRPDMVYHLFAEALLAGRPLIVFGDGQQLRSNTYISDCVRGTVQAIIGAEVGEAYNIGGGEAITLNEAIGVLAHSFRCRPTVRHGTVRAGDQRRTMADTSKAREAFGYRATVPPAVGLRRQAQWHLARRPRRTRRALPEPVPQEVR